MKMKTKDFCEEDTELTICKACRGKGGRYIYANPKKKTDVIYEECSVCEGEGEVEDSRTREEKLDDWQNETNLWIDCDDCDGDGYIIDDDDNEIVCQKCEGYGVVKDHRTPEEREAERIETEKRKFMHALHELQWEDEIDFYGDREEKNRIKCLEKELNTLKASVKKIEEAYSNSRTNIIHEIQGISKKVEWISLVVAILFIMQCSGIINDKVEDDVEKVRKDIESLERSVDKVNDNVKELDDKLDGFQYKKEW